MGVLKRAVRGAAVSAVTLAVLVAGTGTASASDQDRGVGVIGEGSMEIFTRHDGTGFIVCVTGHIEDTSRVIGTWTLAINGSRGAVPFTQSLTSGDWDVSWCEPVSKNGAQSGTFTVDFAYTAIGSYMVVHATGGGVWDPRTGDHAYYVDH